MCESDQMCRSQVFVNTQISETQSFRDVSTPRFIKTWLKYDRCFLPFMAAVQTGASGLRHHTAASFSKTKKLQATLSSLRFHTTRHQEGHLKTKLYQTTPDQQLQAVSGLSREALLTKYRKGFKLIYFGFICTSSKNNETSIQCVLQAWSFLEEH